MTEPIDETHRESIEVIRQIRAHVTFLRTQAAVWQPGPCPDEWGTHPPSTTIRHDYRRRA